MKVLHNLILQVRASGADLRRHWCLALVLLALYAMAQHWLAFNWTDSIPEKIVWIEYGATPQRGELTVFDYRGALLARSWSHVVFGRERLVKRVAGVAGDVLSVTGRYVYVNGMFLGLAKRISRDGQPLDPITPGVVPAGYLAVKGDSADSFDSRYAQLGLIRVNDLVGVAHRLW